MKKQDFKVILKHLKSLGLLLFFPTFMLALLMFGAVQYNKTLDFIILIMLIFILSLSIGALIVDYWYRYNYIKVEVLK